MMNATTTCLVTLSLLVGMAGCAATEPADAAPQADDETLDETQSVTSGSWTATANAPVISFGELYGSASFAGPAGTTRKAGVCLLKKTTTTCSTATDCAGVSVPTGGARYCTAPNGVGTKYCYVRNGTQGALCAGSPALGGAAVAPGTYYTPSVSQAGTYISYACFEGCAATDPSASSSTLAIASCEGWCFCKKYPDHPSCLY